ncbi:MAG: hypothetical protein JSW55_14185 [Chloroflexota bacterium]|nr:MAG: hypothetical protein JSW55_14185 [Chloroflexota bacterium]
MRSLALYVTAMLLVAATLVACSGDSEVTPTEETPPAEETAMPEAYPVEEPTAMATAYPAQIVPTIPQSDAGYPIPEPLPTKDPYPGGLAVILHPVGQQCEVPTFPELADATAALEDAGITVMAAEKIALDVCAACSCPTSEHYRVQISPDDLLKAIELGWTRG